MEVIKNIISLKRSNRTSPNAIIDNNASLGDLVTVTNYFDKTLFYCFYYCTR